MDLLFGFSGRIGRLQWWLGQLVMLIMMVIAGVLVFGIAQIDPGLGAREALTTASTSVVVIFVALSLLIAWINIATTVKRFHDRDKSGFWILITFVPYIGSLWILVECGFLSGTRGGNSYGPSKGSARVYDFGDLDAGVAETSPRVERSRIEKVAPSAPAQPSVPQVRRPVQNGFGRRGL